MLSFVFTDAAVAAPALRKMLAGAVDESYNCVSVDGDTSTNDTVFLLANGAAGNRPVREDSRAYNELSAAVHKVTLELAKMIARDGEGATCLVEIEVRNAASAAAAKRIAATIATSPLVKTAVFGRDANWGRIIAAAGRAGVKIDPEAVDIYLGNMLMARRGLAAGFSEARARKLLCGKEVKITLDLRQGKSAARYYTCDFSFDYVKVNASYRS
jgi:glutamate N-acetyltransferase/amino-acid N-acetyltransferase